MASLIIEKLCKRYGGDPGASGGTTSSGGGRTFALQDFSLEVGDGELVAIVGPSGCGKSTLLRTLAGLEEASSGSVRLGGRVLDGLPPKDRDLALMFQSYTLLPHLTVAENLAFGLKLRGESRASREAKAREAAELLGIVPLLGRLPAEISGGERQRVALGRAILRSPKAFLFDEPLSSLDAQMRLQLRVEIQRLHQRARVPMLFVTHDQTEALTLGDRVVVLEAGRIQQVAPPEELYSRPANAFVASFIGAPGMNLFEGRIERGGTEGADGAQGVVEGAVQGVVGAARFVSPALTLKLSPALAARLGARGAVTLGLRPERLRPSSDGPLQGEVTAVERQAGQLTVYLRRGDQAFAARLADAAPASPVRAGDSTRWTFDAEDMFWFDAGDGAAIP